MFFLIFYNTLIKNFLFYSIRNQNLIEVLNSVDLGERFHENWWGPPCFSHLALVFRPPTQCTKDFNPWEKGKDYISNRYSFVSWISPGSQENAFSNASVNLFYLENNSPNGLDEGDAWCSYPCQSHQVSWGRCLGCPACPGHKHLPLVKETDGCCCLKNEAGRSSKGKDVLNIIVTKDLVKIHIP